MAAANAQIGVAKAAYYPNISLGGWGFESSAITTLISGPRFLVGRPSALFLSSTVEEGVHQTKPSLRTIKQSPLIARPC